MARHLLARFKSLQELGEVQVDPKDLGDQVIDWGTYKDKTFKGVYDSHPEYVKWCLQHSETDQMKDTKASKCKSKWFTYIEMRIEEHEVMVHKGFHEEWFGFPDDPRSARIEKLERQVQDLTVRVDTIKKLLEDITSAMQASSSSM